MPTRHYAKTVRRYLRNTKAVSALEYAMLVSAVALGLGGEALRQQGETFRVLIERINPAAQPNQDAMPVSTVALGEALRQQGEVLRQQGEALRVLIERTDPAAQPSLN